MNINWNSEKYASNFNFVYEYGEDVINLLDIKENMDIIDLGCGNGVLTKKLSEGNVNVIGIDASEDMIRLAKETYRDLSFLCADAAEFKLKKPADAVFSNAVFHWIDDHEKLLHNISLNLKTGGQLVCEFGGYGNGEKVHSALECEFKKEGLEYKRTFYFPTIGEYASILEKCGYKVIYAVLFDRPTKQQGENGLEEWINMFVKQPFSDVSEEKKRKIIDNAVSYLKDCLYIDHSWYVDYVRIRLKAIKK